ncbi:MAG: 2-oxo acid dehydrogenase subunit E2 [Bacteroidia bacterium]
MAEIVRMPKLSDTMTEGTVAKWHKKIGDKVKSGDLLADIETDKATMEFESFQDGVLLYIGVEEKKSATVDGILAILGKEGEDVSEILKSESNSTAVEVPASNGTSNESTEKKSTVKIPDGVEVVKMPKLSDTMTEGTVAKWHKKVGDKVKSGELLADIETDKATMEFESFQDGVLIYQGVEEGKSAMVDGVLAILGKGGEDVKAILEAVNAAPKTETKEPVKEETKAKSVSTPTTAVQTNNIVNTGGRIKASPLAKALAKEKGIDLSQVKGSGDYGRIIKSDIENFKGGTGAFNAKLAVESFIDEPASQMRKTIARRLLESKNGAPHFYLTVEIDMDNAISAREAINNVSDVKTSFNDLVIKASAAALRKHPRVNSSWRGDAIRINHHIHIGVAVAVEDGLLVPVVRFADQKSLQQISSEVKFLGKAAKDKKLQPNDWEGNTFTISNLGMFGIESFTSIINSPESCILSVGAIRQIPVVKNNQIVPGNVMKVTLACDHRSVDGATGAAFLQTLKTYLENPVTIFI